MKALVIDGTIVAVPASKKDLKAAYPNISFKGNMTDEELAQYGYVNVIETPRPSERHTPQYTLQNGQVVQSWVRLDEGLAVEKEAARSTLVANASPVFFPASLLNAMNTDQRKATEDALEALDNATSVAEIDAVNIIDPWND